MRTVLLEHSNRQDEQGSLTIEGVNLWPGKLFDLVDSRTREFGAVVLRPLLILRWRGGRAHYQYLPYY
jgi:hypothetical protein